MLKTLPTIEDELNKLEKPEDYSKAVYVMHMPPANLGLDCCSNGDKIGSLAIYRFIKHNQPRLTFMAIFMNLLRCPGIGRRNLGKLFVSNQAKVTIWGISCM